MAEVVVDKQKITIQNTWKHTILIAIGAGALWWVLWMLLRQYILDVPATAGSVAHVFVGVIATSFLIKYAIARPLLVALPSAITLWGLGGYLASLWWLESLLWVVVFFLVAYSLFSLVARVRSIWIACLFVCVIVALLLFNIA